MDAVRQVLHLLRSKAGRFFWRHFTTEWTRANHYLAKTDCLYEKLIGEAEKAGKLEQADGLYAEWQAKRQPEILEVERLEAIYLSRKTANYKVRTIRLTAAGVWRAIGGKWTARHKESCP